eukprot:scaffold138490_cov28-Prasinocladus_malaysianus.AAC.2
MMGTGHATPMALSIAINTFKPLVKAFDTYCVPNTAAAIFFGLTQSLRKYCKVKRGLQVHAKTYIMIR